MDTINNMVNAASKAVFGSDENRQEPVSGVRGDTSKGEPYDAGNMDPPPGNPAKANTKDDNSCGQNDVRSPSDPATDPTPKGEDVSSGSSGLSGGASLDDKAGPKPIAAVAKEHGGDAGNVGKDGDESSSSASSISDQEHPKGPTEKKGTGEEYVKSSGLKADGGDFDAAKAGAGREAERLLEVKGIRPDSSDGKADGPTEKTNDGVSDDANGNAEKKKTRFSLGHKIKQKLHSH